MVALLGLGAATFGTEVGGGSVAAADPAGETGEQTRLVVTASGLDESARRELAASVGGEVGTSVDDDTFVVAVAPGTDDQRARLLAAGDQVASVEADGAVVAARTTDDPCRTGCPIEVGMASQPQLDQVSAPSAWDITTGSASVRVAVLDTAIDTSHPDLAGKVVAGPTYVSSPTTCAPGTSFVDHGTAVAGVIGANTNNGVGIAGVGWQTTIVGVTVLDGCGRGSTSDVAAAVTWAADNGIDVINLSLVVSSSGEPQHLHDALAYAAANDVVIVGAAGNADSTTPTYPAADPVVVGVGSVDGADHPSSFSNKGSWVDVAAPGENVLSTVSGATAASGYARVSGTSFATPFVSATAALVKAVHPTWSGVEIAEQLRATAEPVVGTGTAFASGRVDTAAAVGQPSGGYWLIAADGGVFTFGDAHFAGSGAGTSDSPVVGAAGHPSGIGYWTVRADGTVQGYGAAAVLGSATGAAAPAVGMAATPTGEGYWVVGSDGGIFAFGDAEFFGSTGSLRLNRPIVGMSATPSGDGYWLVASDGGIFAFGNAAFYGSTGSLTLNRPIVGMAATPSGDGYWLVASDGGIFAFGDAWFFGSTGSLSLNQPIVAMVAR